MKRSPKYRRPSPWIHRVAMRIRSWLRSRRRPTCRKPRKQITESHRTEGHGRQSASGAGRFLNRADASPRPNRLVQQVIAADPKNVDARAAMAKLYISEGKRAEVGELPERGEKGVSGQLGRLPHAGRFLLRSRRSTRLRPSTNRCIATAQRTATCKKLHPAVDSQEPH